MTKVSYALKPIGNIKSHVLAVGAVQPDVVKTGPGLFLTYRLDGKVVGRSFDADVKHGAAAFQVSTDTGVGGHPQAAVLANGNIVVTYDSLEAQSQVYFRLISPAGAPIGDSVNFTFSGQDETDPDVAALKDGGFVVTWDAHSTNDTTTLLEIRNADGTLRPLGFPFLTFDDATSSYLPKVTGLAGGGFAVTYTETDNAGGSQRRIYARVFDANLQAVGGTPADRRIPVETSDNYNGASKLIGLKDGGFAVVYRSDAWNTAVSDADVTMQIFNADGSPRTGHLRVNAANLLNNDKGTAGAQTNADVVQMKNGAILVSWESQQSETAYGLQARVFDPKGHALTRVTTLASGISTNSDNFDTSFAALRHGHLAAAWTRYGADGDDVMGGVLDLVRKSVGTKHGDKIEGDALTDRIIGKGGGDKLAGGGGDDRLSGGKGDDDLYGGKGGDHFAGGAGADRLYAGKGDARDVFIFGKGSSDRGGPDRIYGFDSHAKHEHVFDKIDLSHLHVKWHDIGVAQDGQNLTVSIDYKGSGKADMAIEVMDTNHLHRADFIL